LTYSAPLQGEIIPPGQGLTLLVKPHLFRPQIVRVYAPAGLTLEELASRARGIAGVSFRFTFVAKIDEHYVPEELWPRVRPKPGTTVKFSASAGFDSTNELLKTVVGVAGLAASILIPGIGPLVGTAITLGGSLLIDALFPIPKPQLAIASDNRGAAAESSQTYSVSGGQNSAKPYGVIPQILGRHRFTLDLGAIWYTETVGADQFLRGILIAGIGPKEISAIKIGETPIESFSDYQLEVFEGYDTDALSTLYPSEVEPEEFSIDLSVAAGPQQRTTAIAIDEISIDVVAPGGVLRVDTNNAAQTYTVQLRVDYSPAGAGVWSLLGQHVRLDGPDYLVERNHSVTSFAFVFALIA
jgi:hypothetical protein